MAMTTPTRAAALVSLVVAAWLIPWQAGMAGDGAGNEPPSQSIQVSSTEVGSRSVALGVSKSMVVDFPRDIKDVLIADPKIANAVIRSARRAYIIGIKQGQTNVFFFDAQGRQLAGFDLAVTRNLGGIRTALKQIMPDSDIRVEGIGDGIVLSGVVSSQAEAQQAYDIATRLASDGDGFASLFGGTSGSSKIVNNIIVRGRDQIMLRVTVAEVERDVVKQLGINLSGSLGYGTNVVNFNNYQSILRVRPVAHRLQHCRHDKVGQRDIAGDGAGRCDPYIGRAKPDGDFRRDRNVHGRWRISGPERIFLHGCHRGWPIDVPTLDRVQEVRRQPELHAGRAQ